MELIKRELAKTSVKISIEALKIIICKCTKDCFRYYSQKRDFVITRTWLNSFIKQNKLDEMYSVKQTPNSTFSIKLKDERDSIVNPADQREQSYLKLPGRETNSYRNLQTRENPLKSVDKVVDTIAKKRIPVKLNVNFCFTISFFIFLIFFYLVT